MYERGKRYARGKCQSVLGVGTGQCEEDSYIMISKRIGESAARFWCRETGRDTGG